MTVPDFWSHSVADDDGAWTLRVLADDAEPVDRLIVSVETESTTGHVEAAGLSLSRASVQELRHAITSWLVGAAPPVAGVP